MAKKTRKSVVKDNVSEIILNEIEDNTRRDWCFNFKINNEFKLTEVHESFLQMLLYKDTKMAIVDGPAGSAKSYLAVYGALQMLLKKQAKQIVYIRSIIESASKSIGSLPGEIGEKFHPWSLPLIEKLDELVGSKVGGDLMRDNYVKCMPVNFVRGLTFRDSVVIVDEVQNMVWGEAVAVLTRFGENSKYIVIGDSKQSDIGAKSCFSKVVGAFNNAESEEKGIHTFMFTENEVVRSEILKFIVKQIESVNHSQPHH